METLGKHSNKESKIQTPHTHDDNSIINTFFLGDKMQYLARLVSSNNTKDTNRAKLYKYEFNFMYTFVANEREEDTILGTDIINYVHP